MKIAVSGSRGFGSQELIDKTLNEYKDVCTLIIHGGCQNSADIVVNNWAVANNIPTEIIRPDYKNHKHCYAPILRNQTIISKAGLLLAFYNGTSKGTLSTINFARKKGIEIKIITNEQ